MTRARPTFERVEQWFPEQNVMKHVRPLYYEGDGGVVIKGRTYEFLVSSALGRHIPYDPRKLPMVVERPLQDTEFYLPIAVARIYRDGYRGGTTIERPSFV